MNETQKKELKKIINSKDSQSKKEKTISDYFSKKILSKNDDLGQKNNKKAEFFSYLGENKAFSSKIDVDKIKQVINGSFKNQKSAESLAASAATINENKPKKFETKISRHSLQDFVYIPDPLPEVEKKALREAFRKFDPKQPSQNVPKCTLDEFEIFVDTIVNYQTYLDFKEKKIKVLPENNGEDRKEKVSRYEEIINDYFNAALNLLTKNGFKIFESDLKFKEESKKTYLTLSLQRSMEINSDPRSSFAYYLRKLKTISTLKAIEEISNSFELKILEPKRNEIKSEKSMNFTRDYYLAFEKFIITPNEKLSQDKLKERSIAAKSLFEKERYKVVEKEVLPLYPQSKHLKSPFDLDGGDFIYRKDKNKLYIKAISQKIIFLELLPNKTTNFFDDEVFSFIENDEIKKVNYHDFKELLKDWFINLDEELKIEFIELDLNHIVKISKNKSCEELENFKNKIYHLDCFLNIIEHEELGDFAILPPAGYLSKKSEESIKNEFGENIIRMSEEELEKKCSNFLHCNNEIIMSCEGEIVEGFAKKLNERTGYRVIVPEQDISLSKESGLRCIVNNAPTSRQVELSATPKASDVAAAAASAVVKNVAQNNL
jgi:hypothetical protein